MNILIFVHEINPRVSYAFDLVFRQILKTSYLLTSDKEEYLSANGPKFVYRKNALDKGLFFYSADLLFEKGIKSQNLPVISQNGLRVFYLNEGYGCLGFDPFAASFYLVSRYEEYTVRQRDSHNRFDHTHSLAKRNNFLHVPVVNYYAKLVKERIQEAFPDAAFPELTYTYQPTLDIDNAFAYKHKSFTRMFGSFCSSLFRFKLRDFKQKLNIYFGDEKDPYDTYERQIELHAKFRLSPTYFFLVGDLSKFDRNLPYNNPAVQEIVKEMADRYEIGLHPSYQSNRKVSQLVKEKERLEEMIGKKITKSRQHFLKLKLPVTYQNLIAQGIKEDFSMGYSREMGFRAGITSPFYFYDLTTETMTDLLVHPFCIMDSTLKFYLKVRSSEVAHTVKPLIEHVKNVKGELVTIFHNESFGTHKIWKRWEGVYEAILRLAVPR